LGVLSIRAREIAHAEQHESEAILALHREAGWPGTHVAGEVWVAREAGQVVGSAQLIELEPALVLVDAVVVRANARNRGIGAELMRTVLTRRAAHWWLECRSERVAFYQRLGFAVVNEAEVPSVVKARVGSNHVRPQFFLHGSTIGREVGGRRDCPTSA
jgi:N-acetylglutamate synthase-like GNAT family acetyltransferase